MTRINTIDVELLTDQHLMAEYRELPMVNASLKRSLKSKNGVTGIPAQYTLNAGHVKFFYDKGKFLLNRYKALIDELYKREYVINPSERSVDWSMFDNTRWKDWQPSLRDHSVNVERIAQRISEKPGWYRYHRKVICEKFVILNYNRFLVERTENDQ